MENIGLYVTKKTFTDGISKFNFKSEKIDNTIINVESEPSLASLSFYEIKENNGAEERINYPQTLFLGERVSADEFLKGLDPRIRDRYALLIGKTKDIAVLNKDMFSVMKPNDITLKEALSQSRIIPYVEKEYNSKKVVEKIDSKDTFTMDVADDCLRFRFLEVALINMAGKTVHIGSNYSKWIYFGERLSLADIAYRVEWDNKYIPLFDEIMENGISSVCQNGHSFVPLKNGDITYDEYLALSKKTVK